MQISIPEPIIAHLDGSDICEAEGIRVQGMSPVLTLCRRLLRAGLDSDRPMVVYRKETLALRIRSLGDGAKWRIKDGDDGVPRMVRYQPHYTERDSVIYGLG